METFIMDRIVIQYESVNFSSVSEYVFGKHFSAMSRP